MPQIETARSKYTSKDIPELSAYSGTLIANMSGAAIRLSKVRPEGLSVDKPLEIAMMAPTRYLLAYVHEIARKDIEKARTISELVEVPYVKQLQGESKYVVEKKHLSEIIFEEASRIGDEAAEDLAKMIFREAKVPA